MIPDSFVVIRVVCSFTVSHCFIEEDIGVYLCSISLFYLRGYWCLSLQYLIVLFKRVLVFIFAYLSVLFKRVLVFIFAYLIVLFKRVLVFIFAVSHCFI